MNRQTDTDRQRDRQYMLLEHNSLCSYHFISHWENKKAVLRLFPKTINTEKRTSVASTNTNLEPEKHHMYYTLWSIKHDSLVYFYSEQHVTEKPAIRPF